MGANRTGPAEAFRLGERWVAPATCEIDGVHIHAKAMDVLIALVDVAPSVVSPPTLLDRVWGDSVVVDNVVYQAITHLRRALGDDVHVPRYIETIPRRGYRLIAAIGPRKLPGCPSGHGAVNDWASIAVLPFASMSSDTDQAHFSDGLVEELIMRLSKVPALRVVSRSSSFFYKGRDAKLPDVARELCVAYILEGSVRKVGKRVRVAVQLLHARTDTHLWSGAFDRDFEDALALEDEIAGAVVDQFVSTWLRERP